MYSSPTGVETLAPTTVSEMVWVGGFIGLDRECPKKVTPILHKEKVTFELYFDLGF